MVSLVGGLFIALFGGVGLAIVGVGVANLRKWWTMRGMDPATPATIEAGLQELEGRARAVDGTVTAPFSGTESLLCEHEIERYSHDDDGSNWDTQSEGTETVPFEVEHGGPTVAVVPEDATRLLTEEFRIDTAGTDEYPPGVEEYIEGGETIEIGPIDLDTRGGRFRFTERRLEPGEEVYVLGAAERGPSVAPAGSDARLAIDPGDRGWRDRVLGTPFVVSDSGEERAQRRQLKRGGGLVLFGAIFAGVALAMLLLPAGFG